MNKEFIPYEQALALKELGFNEECFSFYSCDNADDVYFSVDPDDLTLDWVNHSQYDFNNAQHIYRTSAPLYQQAFRWFREKYKVDSMIQPTYSTKYQYRMFHIEGKTKVQIYGAYMGKEFKTYEEAELECLKKLIEIVKTKQI